jgi:hypothetical protein
MVVDMKKILLVLIIASIAYGSGNIELSDGKLRANIDWLDGVLYFDGGNIGFDNKGRGNSRFFWDDANTTLIVYTIDANSLDINDINAITGQLPELSAV